MNTIVVTVRLSLLTYCSSDKEMHVWKLESQESVSILAGFNAFFLAVRGRTFARSSGNWGEPMQARTVLRTCVCMFVCLVTCLWPYINERV